MKREWTVYLDSASEYGAGDDLEASVRDLTTCLLRLGGVGAICPLRQGVRDDDGKITYLNVGVHFKYDSYAPGINPDPEAQEAEVPVIEMDEEEEAEKVPALEAVE